MGNDFSNRASNIFTTKFGSWSIKHLIRNFFGMYSSLKFIEEEKRNEYGLLVGNREGKVHLLD